MITGRLNFQTAALRAIGLCFVLGLAACGNRPGRDDEVLYADAYPDLASIPEDKSKSGTVPLALLQRYNAFQAVGALPVAQVGALCGAYGASWAT